jgi:hypothetical protein
MAVQAATYKGRLGFLGSPLQCFCSLQQGLALARIDLPRKLQRRLVVVVQVKEMQPHVLSGHC